MVTNIYDIEQTLSLPIYISFIQRFDDGKVNGKNIVTEKTGII